MKSREERLSFSLLTMGISVAAGAFTTMLSGFFLLFPAIVFFSKMGVLILTTVAVSITFALTFFCALVAAVGPQGDSGHIPVKEWWAQLRKKVGR